MRALIVGASKRLEFVERPIPSPGRGEVVIRVEAAGVNRADCLQRRGQYPPPPGASDIVGLEVSGTVHALGAGVQSFRLADPVVALLTGGGYAEYALADERCCLPPPWTDDLAASAAAPEALFTVWSNLFQGQAPYEGRTLLLHGGTSGLGVFGIQLARLLGQTVYVTCGSAAKCERAVLLGASRAIHYKDEQFEEVIAEITNGRGVDTILDCVGGSYLARNLKALAPEGRLCVISVQGGTEGVVPLLTVMKKRLCITGSTLRDRPGSVKEKLRDELLQQVWPLLSSGKIKPVIHARVPFTDANEAHRMMEAGESQGKIVIRVGADS